MGFLLVTAPTPKGILHEQYSSSEVVLVAEITKLCVSALLVSRESNDVESTSGGGVGTKGMSRLIWLARHSKQVVVLVLLYSIANLLAYYALARVAASVYSVTNQVRCM